MDKMSRKARLKEEDEALLRRYFAAQRESSIKESSRSGDEPLCSTDTMVSGEGSLPTGLEAHLRFEKLVARLSIQFIDLPAEQIDVHINDALGSVAGFFGFNLAAVSKFTGDGTQGAVTHIWTAPEVPPISPGFTEQDFPWKARLLTQGNDFRAPTLAALPPEAAVDRATYEQLGIRSVYDWCLRPGGSVIGCLSLIAVGQPRPFPDDFAGGLQLFAQVLANALARERADQSMRESQARLAAAVDLAGLGFYELGSAAESLFVDEHLRALLGLPREEVHRAHAFWVEHLHPEDRERVLELSRKALNGDLDSIALEYRYQHPSQGTRWLSHVSRPHQRDTAGKVVRRFGVIQDITKRRQAEEELRRSCAEIEQLKNRLQAESDYLKSEIKLTQVYGAVIGQSAGIKKVLRQVEQVAPTDSSVLIHGETGTGKELIAQAIHRLSPRKGHVMVKVNCAALPSALVESELFGREKGAFTGALTRQIGRFEVADQSTVFLDEVGELSLEVQAKLLRVLQEGQFERLGSPKTVKVNVRVIAATNRNLLEEVRAGRFREDLYYRLNVFPIRVPPLRERAEDIPSLTWAFLDEFSSRMGKKITQVPRKTMEALQRHPWPGNVRELRNVIEHGTIVTPGSTLTLPLLEDGPPASRPPQTLADSEREHILRILEKTAWRIKGPDGAATVLGLNPSTLYSRMEKLGIPSRRQRERSAP